MSQAGHDNSDPSPLVCGGGDVQDITVCNMGHDEHPRMIERRVRADCQRYENLRPYQRLTDRGDLMTHGVPAIVVQTMREAADRIRYLEYVIALRSN